MTTIAQAHAALSTAVGASPEIVAGPACIVFSGGSDLTQLGGTGVAWGFSVLCYVGARDNAVTTAELAAYVQTKLAVILALAGWRLVSVDGDTTRTLAGSELLTAVIAVTTKVDLT